ncbi:hypothetical protein LCGC14_2685890, partial [marine sediment metagenome]
SSRSRGSRAISTRYSAGSNGSTAPAAARTGMVSPMPMTLVGGPLPGAPNRALRHRKHVTDCSYVLSRLRGSDIAELDQFAVAQMGVCGTEGVFATEPQTAPDAAPPGTGLYLVPDAGALPRWVDLTDSSVSLVDVPASGTIPVVDDAKSSQSGLGDTEDGAAGVSGKTLLPLFICDLAGVSFDLLELEFSGTISPSERDALGTY